MTKDGHKREQSYEGHLGFKSAVSPLIFPFGEEEKIENFDEVVWSPILLQGKKKEKIKEKKLLLR